MVKLNRLNIMSNTMSKIISSKDDDKTKIQSNPITKREITTVHIVPKHNKTAFLKDIEVYKTKLKLAFVYIYDEEHLSTTEIEGYEIRQCDDFACTRIYSYGTMYKLKKPNVGNIPYSYRRSSACSVIWDLYKRGFKIYVNKHAIASTIIRHTKTSKCVDKIFHELNDITCKLSINDSLPFNTAPHYVKCLTLHFGRLFVGILLNVIDDNDEKNKCTKLAIKDLLKDVPLSKQEKSLLFSK